MTATNAQGRSAPELSEATPVIAAEALANTSAPRTSGTPRLGLGGSVSTDEGSWSSSVDFFTYQWRRCDAEGEGCEDIEDATSSSYAPTAADYGARLRALVTAHVGEAFTASGTSAATAVVSVPTSGLPSNFEAPAVSGRAENGHTLRATEGLWGGATPIRFFYQWERCTTPTSCSAISGATFLVYVVRAADVGKRIRFSVIGQNGSGFGSPATSALTDTITDPAPRNLTAPSVVGDAVVGAPLSVELGEWAGAIPYWIVSWQRCDERGASCVAIPNSFRDRYRPVLADLGGTVRAVVRGENGIDGDAATTASSAVVSAAAHPENTADPSISGTAEAGQLLFADVGTWSGSEEIDYDYQWRRCDEAGAGCADIADATESSYRVARGDVGATLLLSVTATNGAGSVSAVSDPTEVVADPGAISNVFPPFLAEWWTPSFDEDYEAFELGWWEGSPDITHQWQRCDPLTTDPETLEMTCVDIAGATDPWDYEPTAADVGYKLRLAEIGSDGSEEITVYSPPTGEAVTQFAFDEEGAYNGLEVVGETITADSTVESNAGLRVTTDYTFLREEEGEETTLLQEGEEPSYRLTAEEVGHRVIVEMTASIWRADEETVVDTREVWVTTEPVEAAPSNDTPPSISGTALAGATLDAEAGEWSGGVGPLTYAYQWRRCDSEGARCADIEGATDTSYRLATADVGGTVRVRVTARSGPASGTADSAASAVIAAAEAPVNTVAPAITGTAAELETLRADEGTWTGDDPITFAYQWLTCDPD
ncbi:MAG TPA: hypothetical protein VK506_10695, partial [Conexibacter sp.]|nr:hypothetical protein [Conexibacter sp.]